MIQRTLTDKAKSLLTQFPIISISGPRQSGKTTFSRLVSPDFEYVNVELPDQRLLAEKDPRTFLGLHSNKVILDEVQNEPHLFSYVQVFSHERNTNGQYILTGS